MPVVERLTWTGLDVSAADRLRALLTRGGFEPGEHLRETELAESLGISRGTLRVALKQLAYEGLVDYRPGRGIFVADFRAEDAWEIYTLRNTLEAMAARLAAERVDPQDRKALERSIANIAKAANDKDRAALTERERDFHRLVVRLARHRRLQAAYDLLDGQTRAFMARTMTDHFHPDLAEVLEAHASLASAIADGDRDRAERLAATHNTADGEVLVRDLGQKTADSPKPLVKRQARHDQRPASR